jgi:hypothetical protein
LQTTRLGRLRKRRTKIIKVTKVTKVIKIIKIIKITKTTCHLLLQTFLTVDFGIKIHLVKEEKILYLVDCINPPNSIHYIVTLDLQLKREKEKEKNKNKNKNKKIKKRTTPQSTKLQGRKNLKSSILTHLHKLNSR